MKTILALLLALAGQASAGIYYMWTPYNTDLPEGTLCKFRVATTSGWHSVPTIQPANLTVMGTYGYVFACGTLTSYIADTTGYAWVEYMASPGYWEQVSEPYDISLGDTNEAFALVDQNTKTSAGVFAAEIKDLDDVKYAMWFAVGVLLVTILTRVIRPEFS